MRYVFKAKYVDIKNCLIVCFELMSGFRGGDLLPFKPGEIFYVAWKQERPAARDIISVCLGLSHKNRIELYLVTETEIILVHIVSLINLNRLK